MRKRFIAIVALASLALCVQLSAKSWVELKERDGYRLGERTVVAEEGSGEPGKTIEIAVGFLGTPYSWAGSTPVEGFDSSGFVHEVFRLNGLSIPRALIGQFQTTRPVSHRALQPGDLIFFGLSEAQPDLVGIYIGEDKFVHASPRAKAVVLSEISGSFYQQRLLSAGRPEYRQGGVLPSLTQILSESTPTNYITTYTNTTRSFTESEPIRKERDGKVVEITSRRSTPRYYNEIDQDIALFEPDDSSRNDEMHSLKLRLGEMTDTVVSSFPYSWPASVP